MQEYVTNIRILLGLLLPGTIVVGGTLVLFPEYFPYAPEISLAFFAAAFMFITTLVVHLPFALELLFFDWLWSQFYRSWKIKPRRYLFLERERILAEADIHGISHQAYDFAFGEHILWFNTAIWLLVIAVYRISIPPTEFYIWLLAVVTILSTLLTLLRTSPFLKKQCLDILEILEQEIRAVKEAQIRQSQNHTGRTEQQNFSTAHSVEREVE